LRYTDQGRALLRLVSATLAFLDQSVPMVGAVPGHCRRSLDLVVRACDGGWLDFAEQLEEAELPGDDGACASPSVQSNATWARWSRTIIAGS